MIKITCDRCGREICQTVNGNTAIAAIHDYHNDGSPERETLCEECKPLELSLLPCPVCGMKPQVKGPLETFCNKYVVHCSNCNPGFGHAIEFSDVELKVAAAAWDDFATRGRAKGGDGMKCVYIAGPMAGLPDLNFPAFFAAEKRLDAAGLTIVNPARFTSVFGEEPTGKLLEAVCESERAAIPHLDAIYLLHGWEKSKGAKRELAVALLHGLEVIVE